MFTLLYAGGRTRRAKPLTRRATMPFSQNWTFCQAFSPLDVAHASKAGAPCCARARYSSSIAERDAGSGLWPAVFATRRPDYLARAKPGARTPSPSGCRVLRAPLWRLGSPAPDGPPDARHWTNVGIGAMTWAAAGRLAPQRVLRCGTSTSLSFGRLLRAFSLRATHDMRRA